MSASNTTLGQPGDAVDAVVERLNDPQIAASLVTLLDNAQLLSMLVSGLNEFLERGDTIIESVASGVRELKDARDASSSNFDVKQATADLKSFVGAINEARPSIEHLLRSGLLNNEVVEILTMAGASAVDGMAAARRNRTTVKGVRGAVHALKDPDVQRGLGLLVEIAKALGSRVQNT